MSKKKGLKILLILAGVAVVVIGIGVALLYSNLNSIARSATERALSYVLQVEVSVASMEVSLSEGSVNIEDLIIGNPEGFKTPEAFAFKQIFVRADIGSFRSDQPVISEILVKGARITLEQGLTSSNFSHLVKNASRLSGDSSAKEGKEEQTSKSIVIDSVILEDARVAVSSPVLQGKDIGFPLPRIEMKEIGRDGDEVTVAQAIQVFLAEILKATLKAGGGLIPEDLSGMVQGTLGTAGKAGEAIGDQLKEDGETLGDGLKSAGESLGGLFKKKEPDENL